MKPIELSEDYGYPKVFGRNQPEFRPLIGRMRESGAATFQWEFSAEEREAIANGANLYMEVQTFNAAMYPIMLWVDGVESEDDITLPSIFED